LVSDAGHNLTDSLSLTISFFAQKIAKREANVNHSYGYGRAALLNGFILVVLALYIFYEAFQRIRTPEPVQGGFVAIVALVGIFVNTSVALLFWKNQTDLNIKSAFINMKYDVLASAGALLAGLIIVFTGLTIFDSLISILIGVLLIRSSFAVVLAGKRGCYAIC
jgi:cobalt-zinc-cadmium efflux system protein